VKPTRHFWVSVGPVFSWLVGFVVGGIVASVYSKLMYLPEPDPVHFDVAGVFLGTSVMIGGVGTVVSVVCAVRLK
jgi:hypothetical protein